MTPGETISLVAYLIIGWFTFIFGVCSNTPGMVFRGTFWPVAAIRGLYRSFKKLNKS